MLHPHIFLLTNTLHQHWYSNPEWWSAIGTIGVGIIAVGIAIFQEKIKAIFTRTSLKISLKVEPPDVHKIKLTTHQGQIDSYYIRAKITNIGSHVAENVEVMINSFYRVEGGQKTKIQTFLPLNLNWSHYGGVSMSRILPGHFRHIDIGYIANLYPKNRVALHIDTAVQPNMVEGDVYPNIIDPGHYEFELIIGSNSTETEIKRFEIQFSEHLYSTEKEMFEDSLKIRECA